MLWCWRCIVSKWPSISPQTYCVIYGDTSSTNINKYNIFDTDYFAHLHVNMAGKNTWAWVTDWTHLLYSYIKKIYLLDTYIIYISCIYNQLKQCMFKCIPNKNQIVSKILLKIEVKLERKIINLSPNTKKVFI